MPEPIFMRIGETKTVELADLSAAIVNFLGLLRDVDSTISDKRMGNLRWKVTVLRDDPFPLIGVTPVPFKPTLRDTSIEVQREVIGNVISLTEKGERSRLFSDAALDKVERIAKTAPKIGGTTIYTAQTGEFNLQTKVTARTLTQIRELTQVTSRAFGNIIGDLGSISVHKGLEIRVWDASLKRPIRCNFKHEGRGAEAKEIEAQAKDLLGKRVLATGTINFDRNGMPLKMLVHSLKDAPMPTLPPIEELMGSIQHFTGGLSVSEFLEDSD
ncbi:MAG: hypothetical protein ABSF28_07910 [Terracidiphilus sp.]|jgi:hypothetical protein